MIAKLGIYEDCEKEEPTKVYICRRLLYGVSKKALALAQQAENKTPEEQEERIRRKKNGFVATGKEKRAMIAAAFAVYGPLLLIVVGAFLLTALFMYFFWL